MDILALLFNCQNLERTKNSSDSNRNGLLERSHQRLLLTCNSAISKVKWKHGSYSGPSLLYFGLSRIRETLNIDKIDC